MNHRLSNEELDALEAAAGRALAEPDDPARLHRTREQVLADAKDLARLIKELKELRREAERTEERMDRMRRLLAPRDEE